MNPLEYASRQELIEELMSRSTFMGAIITTVDEIKDNNKSDIIFYSNIRPEDSLSLLEDAVKQIKENMKHMEVQEGIIDVELEDEDEDEDEEMDFGELGTLLAESYDKEDDEEDDDFNTFDEADQLDEEFGEEE